MLNIQIFSILDKTLVLQATIQGGFVDNVKDVDGGGVHLKMRKRGVLDPSVEIFRVSEIGKFHKFSEIS
jgi:hypothetical protein